MRQIEPVTVKVNGTKYYITPFPAFKAANLSGELASVLAPIIGALMPLANILSEDNTQGSLMDVDVNEAAKAISGCSGISGDKLELLMRKLLTEGNIVVEVPDESGRTEAQRLDYDLANEIFCGEIQDMFVLCFHVIKLNYNSFFGRLLALSGEEPSEEQKKTRKIV